jgi:hypothetical protein
MTTEMPRLPYRSLNSAYFSSAIALYGTRKIALFKEKADLEAKTSPTRVFPDDVGATTKMFFPSQRG